MKIGPMTRSAQGRIGLYALAGSMVDDGADTNRPTHSAKDLVAERAAQNE